MQRMLVTYASRLGSTQGVAEAIAEELRTAHYDVTLLAMDGVYAVDGYDAVVIGSAIRGGQWLPEAVSFVDKFKVDLAQTPVAYFTVCLTLNKDTPETRKVVADYLKPIREVLPAQAEGYFAGKAEPKELPFAMKWIMRLMNAPKGDFRKWDEIRAWAQGLPQALSPQPA